MIDIQVYNCINEAACSEQELKPTMSLKNDLYLNDMGIVTLVCVLNADFEIQPITMVEAKQWSTVGDVVAEVKRRMGC